MTRKPSTLVPDQGTVPAVKAVHKRRPEPRVLPTSAHKSKIGSWRGYPYRSRDYYSDKEPARVAHINQAAHGERHNPGLAARVDDRSTNDPGNRDGLVS
jgi:hypothetical protein